MKLEIRMSNSPLKTLTLDSFVLRHSTFVILLCLGISSFVIAGTQNASAGLKSVARDPYVGAIVVDASTGNVLFKDRAEERAYPASVVKLMDLLIILDDVAAGKLALTDKVTVSAEAERMGGSQVYLAKGETFTVEDLLYALMIKSANDVAVALAEHVAGSKEAFVERMNKKAAELGMSNSRFHSVHGLPPGAGQEPDITTAHDIALLCRAAAKMPEVFRYTSTRERMFRDGTFQLLSHNPMLGRVEGADGFKTGYYRAAGFSIAATASRNGTRVIAVVLGSKTKQARNAKVAELVELGFDALAPAAE